MNSWLKIVLGFPLLCLVGCTSIEHRSETMPISPLPAISAAAPQLTPLWQKKLQRRCLRAQPGLGLRLAAQGDHVFVAGYDGRLWSLHIANGNTQWVRQLHSPIISGPTVVKQWLVLATKQPAVVALRQDTGETVWQQDEQREILAPITVAHDRLFIHALDDTVTARRIKDGALVWQTQNPPLNLVLRKNAAPIPFGSKVAVGFADGKLISFEQSTGAIDWIQELSTPVGHDEFQRMVDVAAAPVVSGNQIFAVNFQGKLSAFVAQTGEKQWSIDHSSFSGLLVYKEIVLSESQGVLLALHKQTGKKVWTQTGLSGRRLSMPAFFHDYLFVGDNAGYLHVLRASTGEYLTQVKTGNTAIEVAPLVVGNRVLVLGEGSIVTAYAIGALSDHA